MITVAPQRSESDKGRRAAIFYSLGAIYLHSREVVIDIEKSLTFFW